MISAKHPNLSLSLTALTTPFTTINGNFRKGIFTYPDGKTYSGSWWNGLRHGQGTRNYPDGSTYTGSWHNDKRHGVVRGVARRRDRRRKIA